MKRDEAIRKLRAAEPSLRAAGVRDVYLFGSTARDEAGPDSDIDLFFDYDKSTIGLYELFDIKELATSVLGARTDMIPRAGLHRLVKSRIEMTALKVFQCL